MLLALIILAYFAETTIYVHLVSGFHLFNLHFLSVASLEFKVILLLAHEFVSEDSTSCSGLVALVHVQTHVVLAYFPMVFQCLILIGELFQHVS
jgi:hypothetical protein